MSFYSFNNLIFACVATFLTLSILGIYTTSKHSSNANQLSIATNEANGDLTVSHNSVNIDNFLKETQEKTTGSDEVDANPDGEKQAESLNSDRKEVNPFNMDEVMRRTQYETNGKDVVGIKSNSGQKEVNPFNIDEFMSRTQYEKDGKDVVGIKSNNGQKEVNPFNIDEFMSRTQYEPDGKDEVDDKLNEGKEGEDKLKDGSDEKAPNLRRARLGKVTAD